MGVPISKNFIKKFPPFEIGKDEVRRSCLMKNPEVENV